MRSILTSLLLFLTVSVGAREVVAAPPVLVTINGRPAVKADDLETLYLINKVAEADRAKYRDQLVQQLVDQSLVEAFLKTKKVEALPEDVEAQVAYVLRNIEAVGDKPDEVFKKLGLTEALLRRQIALPLAWKSYARKTVTDAQIREWFTQHRAELDGTRVRASQIVKVVEKGSDDSKWKAAVDALSAVRKEVVGGTLTFEDAAKKHSDSPSGAMGGDVGEFGFDGKMPRPVVEAAFGLKIGEVSEPVRSPFGVHLVKVTQRTPGDLSPEDVRPQILETLSRKLWEETVAAERKKVKVAIDGKPVK
jgi:peptidyl-prolyl cis-trans isomerase C